MSVSVMMGEQGREAFAQAVRNGPPPMSENERQAYLAQCYPRFPEDFAQFALKAMKPREDGEGIARDMTSEELS